MKCVVITFFNWEGLVYIHTEPDGETVSANRYSEVLKQLITVHIPYKQPHYYNGQLTLHHDNMYLHTAQCVRNFVTSLGVEMIPHAPYSHKFAPCTFFPVSYK